MRQRIAWGPTVMLAAAVWVGTALPAWANSPNFDQYPGLRESYERKMAITFYSVIGCMALFVILIILAVVLIIRGIVRSRRRRAAMEGVGTTATPGAPVPDAPTLPFEPEDPTPHN